MAKEIYYTMNKVLITGATGNVRSEVIKSLGSIDHDLDFYAGVRNLNEEGNLGNSKIGFKQFDFTDASTYSLALEGCDILFL